MHLPQRGRVRDSLAAFMDFIYSLGTVLTPLVGSCAVDHFIAAKATRRR